jgi:hypothetical protein
LNSASASFSRMEWNGPRWKRQCQAVPVVSTWSARHQNDRHHDDSSEHHEPFSVPLHSSLLFFQFKFRRCTSRRKALAYGKSDPFDAHCTHAPTPLLRWLQQLKLLAEGRQTKWCYHSRVFERMKSTRDNAHRDASISEQRATVIISEREAREAREPIPKNPPPSPF